MKKFKLIQYFPYSFLLLQLCICSNLSYADVKKLTQAEFDQLIMQNNQQGLQLHHDLAVALTSGDHKRISENLCETYEISKIQYEIASENSDLLKAHIAKDNAIKNMKNIENVIPKNQKPLEQYCKDFLRRSS